MLKSKDTFTWKIGGEAGYGIKNSGIIFAKVCSRAGLKVYAYVEYPSLIRGGHNTFHITAGKHVARSTVNWCDTLVALDLKTITEHVSEVVPGGTIFYDEEKEGKPEGVDRNDIKLVSVPFNRLAKEIGGNVIMRNTVAIGASLALWGCSLEILETVIKDVFKKKSSAVEGNIKCAKAGLDYFNKAHEPTGSCPLNPAYDGQQVVLTGNEAISLGALAGGCKFYCAYPMTPSSSILSIMAGLADEYDIAVKHAEDEISVINMAIGASYAGVRSMLGTSGGGFALMTEGLGLAGITETPLVILEAQRPGPATGLPTWSDQGDLRFVIHAAQGEFPRLVLAPGDVEEAFYLTASSFNWAEKYQIPVIILSDKNLSESNESVAPLDWKKVKIERSGFADPKKLEAGDYRRYKITDSGVSPRSIPGQPGGVHLANSDEHDERGFSDEESANRTAQVDKRARKLRGLEKELPEPVFFGDELTDYTFISWGSNKGAILDAMELLRGDGIKTNFLHVNIVFPFPEAQVREVMHKAKQSILVECNSTAQFGGLIRQYTRLEAKHTFLKYDGRPFYPEEIAKRVKELAV